MHRLYKGFSLDLAYPFHHILYYKIPHLMSVKWDRKENYDTERY
nr:MAG TPA: hypothetical protein [Caudoviricetes sp.]